MVQRYTHCCFLSLSFFLKKKEVLRLTWTNGLYSSLMESPDSWVLSLTMASLKMAGKASSSSNLLVASLMKSKQIPFSSTGPFRR